MLHPEVIRMGNEPLWRLPLQVSGAEDESTMSFLYRTLRANGISLRDAQHWLGLKSWTPLHPADLSTLAWISGAERTWLAHRSLVTLGRRTNRRYALLGHELGEGMSDYSHRAKLCPACVKRRKYCKASWQVRYVCGCTEHNQILIERCPRCQRPISWNRPAIDICSCGNFLTAATKPPGLPSGIANWTRWMEFRLADASAVVPAIDFGLPPLLGTLSIDGACRLILILGLLSSATEFLTSAATEAKTTEGMAAVIVRGLNRLTLLGRNLEGIHPLEPMIHIAALERMKTTAIAPGDANCATVLLERLRLDVGGQGEKRGRHIRGQLSLPW